jgi:PhoH-like ATPase
MPKKAAKKIFVLDTSVLLFDHGSILNFKNHDVAIPITVLEELDNFKVGNDTKNFQAREIIRNIDRLSDKGLNDWVSLGRGKGKLRIVMANLVNGRDAEAIYGPGKNDHKIINAAITLADTNKNRDVVLVTKDINLRLKAKAIGLLSEDYETGKVKDVERFSEGFPVIENIDSKKISALYKKGSIDADQVLVDGGLANGYYILKNGTSESVLSRFNQKLNLIERVEKNYIYGIKPRNAEQTFAVDALTNPDIKLVCLQGVAGTGKTLLALASALEQRNLYNQIILARPVIPLSNRDIGFLPGTAEDKISPYMQPLWDNLKFIKSQYKPGERKHKVLDDMEDSGELSITALAFIRGRSLTNAMFIIDEAQNLSPHEVKTIITRAGEGTKVVFTGDIKQIDTPYMDEESNGMTYLIDRLKGHDLFAHIKLEKGERSELANLANELL